jgi:hypothetical protein
MTAGRDFLLFVLFLIALGIAWFFTGGPSRAISHAGWFLNPTNIVIPSVSGGFATGGAGGAEGYNLGTETGAETVSGGTNTGNANTGGGTIYQPGFGYVARPGTSPYAKYIFLDAGNAQSSDPNAEYIGLQVSEDAPSLTITGWSLMSPVSNIRVTIGNAAVIPYLGQVNSQTPVTVGPGAGVVLATGQSPNGTSFRVNECTGYFEQFQDFNPSLSKECPLPLDELDRYPDLRGNDTCYYFVETLQRCTFAVNAIPGNIGDLCQNFVLNTLSYNGCITDHQHDPDFYRNSWRLYFNHTAELWKNTHDTIWLLDEKGLLVAELSY